MQSIQSAENLKGKRVLVRASLNEPVKNGALVSDFRLRKMLSTIEFLRGADAKTILAGHASGDPAEHSLLPVAEYFQKRAKTTFIMDPFNDDGKMELANMQDGDVVLLENLRRYPGEKDNDESFGKQLSNLADIYVNECFSASHRAHASFMWPPKFLPSYIGMQFEKELEHFSQALKPPKPSIAIIGGAKPETKVPLVYQLLDTVDKVFVGGLSANEFFVTKGYKIGKSLVSDKELGVKDYMNHPKLLLPQDVSVRSESGAVFVRELDAIEEKEQIVDVGPETLKTLESVISESSFVLWNGPLGDYEQGFREGTSRLAKVIAQSDAKSLVGGGDTIAAIEPLGLTDELTFLSTAGGAMIDFLVDGTFPALEALKEGMQE